MTDTKNNNCLEYEEISAYVDGDLDGKQHDEAQAHIDACQDCGNLAAEIKQLATGLTSIGDEQPPDYLWAKIEAKRREEVSTAWTTRLVDWLGGGHWRVPAAVMVAGAASVIFIFFGDPGQGQIDKPANDSDQVRVMANVIEAERVYKQAIASLEGSFQAEKNNYSDQTLETISKSMADMDSAIERCRQAVNKDPNNIETHKTALALYQRKVDLLSELVIDPL